MQKLLIVKEAVKQVANQMIKEDKVTPLMKDASAKLACTMRYIRAIEKIDWRQAAECRKAFPEIDKKVGGHSDKDIISKNQE
eukprot:1170861-Heterocapsa_arctica.AAC.1